jgi:hypothetical protein
VANDNGISADQFGALFRDFVERSMQSAPQRESHFLQAFGKHFDHDPLKLATVTDAFPISDHPNLHLAVREYLDSPGLEATLEGVAGLEDYGGPLTLARLLTNAAASAGPVQYANVSLDGGEVLACVGQGLFLVRGDRREAILVSGPSRGNPWEKLHLEVMAATQEGAAKTLSRIRALMRERNVYRGRIVSLIPDRYSNSPQVVFHALKKIERQDIILPAGLLERVERHTIGLSKHAPALRSVGRHLKRGMLLHGPPGTGKTLTAMYLAGQMKDRTTFLLTGQGLGLVEESCAMARMLQPATLIIEDVDLVAEERSRQGTCQNAVLFELLNQMDGLSEDSDVLFVLTTNRPEILEPALASRPGRVDLAIEVPLPDLECRRRLIALYGKGLDLKAVDLDRLARKTDGVSGAFVRELLRKAALFALDAAADGVQEAHVDAALHELTILGGELTRSMLGAGEARPGTRA